VVPIPRLLNVEHHLDYVTNRVVPDYAIREALERLWSASAFIDTATTEEKLAVTAAALDCGDTCGINPGSRIAPDQTNVGKRLRCRASSTPTNTPRPAARSRTDPTRWRCCLAARTTRVGSPSPVGSPRDSRSPSATGFSTSPAGADHRAAARPRVRRRGMDGVDLSPANVGIGLRRRSRVRSHGPGPVHLRRRRTPAVPGHRIRHGECVFCTFPDKRPAESELSRVLRPGGPAGITDITADGARLPAQLSSQAAWVACVADARPLEGYAGC